MKKVVINSSRVLPAVALVFILAFTSAVARAERAGGSSQAVPLRQLGAAVERRYSGDGLGVERHANGARLRCVFQRLEAEATTNGLSLASTAGGAKGARFGVTARALGRARADALPAAGRVEVDGKFARWLREDLGEEYSVSADGIRQDFLIPRRVPGAGPLRVELEVSGAEARPADGGAKLALADGGRTLVYHRLKAEDHRGRELPVRLEVRSGRRMELVLDDARAEYPVRIDPTFTDAQWVSLGGVPGADGVVEAAVVDGAGDLYVGGSFLTAGTAAANFVARWNGSEWLPLGSGLNDVVHSLAVGPDGSIYAGGSFTVAGGVPANSIAKWNGEEWSALGSGLEAGFPFTFVAAIAVSGENVYAGGLFTVAGGQPAAYVARWNGSSWSPMGQGVNDIVYAMEFWNGHLYVGGSFNTAGGEPAPFLARWNGTDWSRVGGGLDYGVNSLVTWNGNLYAGGNFRWAVDEDGWQTAVNYVACWNGTNWSALGMGVNNTVVALAASASGLYAGGIFTSASRTPASAIARWNGSAWTALGAGIQSSLAGSRDVKALAADGDTLYVGGNFGSAGANASKNLVRWNGEAWSSIGPDGGPNDPVQAVALAGDGLYVGGLFTFAGGSAAHFVARWDGASWSGLGRGLDGIVNAVAASGSNVYVGGNFTTATNADGSTVAVSRVARWDGSGWSALGQGANSRVTALAASGGNLFVGGEFTTVFNPGGVPVTVNRIARWDGSEWLPLGAGVAGGGFPPFGGPMVRAIAVSGEDVFIGGRFQSADGITVNNVARWNGFEWSPLGQGVYDGGGIPVSPSVAPVIALAVHGEKLYVGGNFISVLDESGSSIPASRIAQWDGLAWSTLGAGVSGADTLSSVRALAAAPDGALYVGGLFTAAGGLPANLLARWDGEAWSSVGAGLSGNGLHGATVWAMTISGTSLFIGGAFTQAGDAISYNAVQVIVGPPTIVTTNGNFGFTGVPSRFGFDVSAGAFQRIITEGSADLVNWTPLQTNRLGGGSLLRFNDPDSGELPRRHYRALQTR